MPLPQRVEGRVGADKRLVELARLDPALADGLGQHAGDVLAVEHGNLLGNSRQRLQLDKAIGIRQ
jgi:hypothetical protein